METNNCDRVRDQLSDYFDDELGASDREIVRSHLETCPQCADTLAAYRRVVGRASALEDRPPEHDLWPGIASRIGARVPEAVIPVRRPRPGPRRLVGVPQLLAAGIAFAAVALGARWMTNDIDLAPTGPAVSGPGQNASFVDPSVTSYDAAIEDLEGALAAERETLDPETVRIVEENLAIIDRALERARQALLADPESEYLREHVENTKRQKLEVLQRVNLLASEL